MIIPVFKLLRVLAYGYYIGACPWQDQMTARYLLMALVTISTIYQTVFAALLLLISKGWVIMRPFLSRENATTLTVLMGAIYLAYSAYYISSDTSGVKSLISGVITVLYIIIFVFVMKNTLHILFTLRVQYRII